MDKSLITYLINVLLLTPVVLLLVVIFIKMSKVNIEKFTSNKYIQVLERINVSKDSSIYLLKTGNTGCVVMSSYNHIEKIKDLNEEEIKHILENKNSLLNNH
ncbi:MAG: hypothetical protein ACRDD7_17485 [Peptostreptococcaceae bacterium]